MYIYSISICIKVLNYSFSFDLYIFSIFQSASPQSCKASERCPRASCATMRRSNAWVHGIRGVKVARAKMMNHWAENSWHQEIKIRHSCSAAIKNMHKWRVRVFGRMCLHDSLILQIQYYNLGRDASCRRTHDFRIGYVSITCVVMS